MKAYEKPDILVFSLSANAVFCQSCAIDAEGSNAEVEYNDLWDAPGAFGASEADACDFKIDDYCKFTAGPMLFNS